MAKLLVTLLALSAPCALISQNLDLNAAPSAANFQGSPRSIKTRFTYRASVPNVPAGTKSLRLWLPVPADSPFQTVTDLNVTSPYPNRVTTERRFGNRMVFIDAATPAGKLDVSVSFLVERKEIAPLASGVKLTAVGDPNAYRQPDALVPIGGRYANIADSVTGSLSRPVDKVRAIYEHTVANMQYDYNKESPKLGMGDVAFVCDYKKGNCSDLHSYMISLARSEGIPAFLEYGFPLCGIPVPGQVPEKGTIGGYHCWMWFYDEDMGWLPVDASDGRRWLDSKRPDVKEKLFGNLVLERSAVALSRGRDLTLEPAQSAGPLNSFIYPYAEADGKPVETKWVMEYELLSPAGTLAYPSGSVQDQMNELRQIVLAQQKEITALKAGGAKAGPGQVTNAAPKQGTKIYGFIRTDAIFDSHATNPNSQFPFWVESPTAAIGRDSERFTLHPRLTRFGIDFAENEETLKGYKLGGKIEIDFQGGGSESRQTPRARHLYATLRRGTQTWLLGQTWDLISPLFPSPNDDSLMWNAGNLGDRRPQVRFTNASADGKFVIAVAAGLTGAIDAKDLDANGIRDGEAAGAPHFQARVAVGNSKGQIGVWGHIAKERTTTAVGGQTNFDSNSIGVDVKYQPTSVLDLMGEFWTGKNLSDFRGGIGQGVVAATGQEVESTGGWFEVGFKLSSKHRVAAGYTMDDPKNEHVPIGGRIRNTAVYLHNKWALSEALDFGLNLIDWVTRYRGPEQGRALRVNLFMAYKY